MKTETVEYVELDHTMPVAEMNYTQAFMERYRLRYKTSPITHDANRVAERIKECDARLEAIGDYYCEKCDAERMWVNLPESHEKDKDYE